jgi:hypothetical protein
MFSSEPISFTATNSNSGVSQRRSPDPAETVDRYLRRHLLASFES